MQIPDADPMQIRSVQTVRTVFKAARRAARAANAASLGVAASCQPVLVTFRHGLAHVP
jgi:hypothetical protein